jgi:hypothetical protein
MSRVPNGQQLGYESMLPRCGYSAAGTKAIPTGYDCRDASRRAFPRDFDPSSSVKGGWTAQRRIRERKCLKKTRLEYNPHGASQESRSWNGIGNDGRFSVESKLNFLQVREVS